MNPSKQTRCIRLPLLKAVFKTSTEMMQDKNQAKADIPFDI